MSEIKHQISIAAPRAEVYRALATIEGLSGWWTRTTSGASDVGSELDFRFGDHVSTMRVATLATDQAVAWECVRSAPDWVGTTLEFNLAADGGKTVVSFSHGGWREAKAFFAHCSTKWAVFLLSLKQYLESGTGRPFPDDIAI